MELSCEGLVRQSSAPLVRSDGIFPEKFLAGPVAFSADITPDKLECLRVGCQVIAVGPVTSIKNVVFSEDVPDGIEFIPIERKILTNLLAKGIDLPDCALREDSMLV